MGVAVVFRVLLGGLCAVLAPLTASAWGAETIAVDDSAPPFMYDTPDGAVGLYPALVREIFHRLNEPVSIQPMPWKRALLMLETGAAGVAGVVKTGDRMETFEFSDPIYVQTTQVLVRRGRGFAFEGVPSLRARRIGVLRGRSYGAEFDTARAAGLFDVQEVSADTRNLDKLLDNQIDAALISREAADMLLAWTESANRIVPLPARMEALPVRIAFARSAEAGPLIARINAALCDMRAEGRHDAIVSAFTR